MVLYLSIIGITVVILSVLNIALGSTIYGLNPWWSIAILIGCVVFEFAVDGLFAFIVNKLPKKWFRYDKKVFKVGKKERKFYDFLKIKKWKDKVWELGALGGFRKNKIYDPNNPEYLKEFLTESYIGVIVHLNGAVFGFTLLFVIPIEYILTVSLPVCIVNVLLNFMSTFVLRYNIPKLEVALERARRNKEREEKEALAKNIDLLLTEKEENVG